MVVAGGKGRASRKTPADIEVAGDIFSLSNAKIEDLVLQIEYLRRSITPASKMDINSTTIHSY